MTVAQSEVCLGFQLISVFSFCHSHWPSGGGGGGGAHGNPCQMILVRTAPLGRDAMFWRHAPVSFPRIPFENVIHHFEALPHIYSWILLQEQVAKNIITTMYRTPELPSAIRGTRDRPSRNPAWKTLHYDKRSGSQTTSKRGLYRHVYGKDCHCNDSRGDTVTPRTPEEGLSLHQLPRKDYHSKNSREKTLTPPTPQAVIPPAPEEGLYSKNSRGRTVTPQTPE